MLCVFYHDLKPYKSWLAHESLPRPVLPLSLFLFLWPFLAPYAPSLWTFRVLSLLSKSLACSRVPGKVLPPTSPCLGLCDTGWASDTLEKGSSQPSLKRAWPRRPFLLKLSIIQICLSLKLSSCFRWSEGVSPARLPPHPNTLLAHTHTCVQYVLANRRGAGQQHGGSVGVALHSLPTPAHTSRHGLAMLRPPPRPFLHPVLCPTCSFGLW